MPSAEVSATPTVATPGPISPPATSAAPITLPEPSGASVQTSVQSFQGSQSPLAGLLRRALRHRGLNERALDDASFEDLRMLMRYYTPISRDN